MVLYGTYRFVIMIVRMRCTERGRLLNLYSEATAKLSRMATALSNSAFTYEVDAFDRAWEHCEDVRILCTQLQRQIHAHLAEHRCVGLRLGTQRGIVVDVIESDGTHVRLGVITNQLGRDGID